MYQAFRIAIRNLTRQKKRSLLLGGALAFGFLVITLVNGFTAGMVTTTKANFSNMFGGHIYISGTVVSRLGTELPRIDDALPATDAIAGLGSRVASVHYRSRSTGTLYFGTNERPSKIDGVDFADEKDFGKGLDLERGSLEKMGAKGSLVLPEDTARKLGAEPGDTLIFKTATVTGQQNVGEFTLIATTRSSGGMAMSSGFTGKSFLNSLIGLDAGKFQTINVYLKDVNDTAAATSLLYTKLALLAPVESRAKDSQPVNISMMKRLMGMDSLKAVRDSDKWKGTKFSVTNIEDIMAPVLSLVAILDTVAFVVFLVLLLIIMVGILNSFRMIMIERTGEIGTMRAIGVQKSMIRNIFLFEGMTVSVLGAAAGFVLALVASGIVSLVNFGSTSFFSVFLSRGHLMFFVSPSGSIANFLILCVMSLAALYLPARKAAKLEPAQALRTTY